MSKPFKIIRLKETPSTNDYAFLLEDGAIEGPLTAVVADHQTKGKGQRGNLWESERGKNLLLSVIMRPWFVPARDQFVLSEMVSMSVVETLDEYAPGFTVKWPNDIYHKDRKIAGILIEHTLSGCSLGKSIAGIGLNINQKMFLSDAPNPVSLHQILNKETDREQVLLGLLTRMNSGIQSLEEDYSAHRAQLHERFLSRLWRGEGLHPFKDKDGVFQARIKDVRMDGPIVLEDTEKKERTYLFKEVQYIL